MSREGQDGSGHCFEITDVSGRLLIELPFSEVFKTTPLVRPSSYQKASFKVTQETTAKSQRLVSEIASLVVMARTTMQQTQIVLARARPQVI